MSLEYIMIGKEFQKIEITFDDGIIFTGYRDLYVKPLSPQNPLFQFNISKEANNTFKVLFNIIKLSVKLHDKHAVGYEADFKSSKGRLKDLQLLTVNSK